MTEFSITDHVSTIPGFSLNKHGVYGKTVIVPAASSAHHPDNLTPAEDAAIWMQA